MSGLLCCPEYHRLSASLSLRYQHLEAVGSEGLILQLYVGWNSFHQYTETGVKPIQTLEKEFKFDFAITRKEGYLSHGTGNMVNVHLVPERY